MTTEIDTKTTGADMSDAVQQTDLDVWIRHAMTCDVRPRICRIPRKRAPAIIRSLWKYATWEAQGRLQLMASEIEHGMYQGPAFMGRIYDFDLVLA